MARRTNYGFEKKQRELKKQKKKEAKAARRRGEIEADEAQSAEAEGGTDSTEEATPQSEPDDS